MSDKVKVLFLCSANASRSQMAEGWARHLKNHAIEPYSAGVDPHGVNPLAVKVMAEVGVDISKQRSKHANELAGIPFDFVVTLCDQAQEACPVFPGGGTRVHVGFDDPYTLTNGVKDEAEKLRVYRRVRDEIRDFVESLPAALVFARGS
jgi:arsenate reductase